MRKRCRHQVPAYHGNRGTWHYWWCWRCGAEGVTQMSEIEFIRWSKYGGKIRRLWAYPKDHTEPEEG